MIIGITGSFGSGKTTVAKMFDRLGAYVIDADKTCHSLMKPGGKVYVEIIKCFGRVILNKAGRIDRKKLAGVVFKNRAKIALLNNIVHPEAIKEIKKLIRSNKGRGVIVVDAPLLIESGFYKKMDKIVLVKSILSNQVSRAVLTRDMGEKEITRRMRMQAPLKKKLALADFIIDNNGSKKKTLLQVKEIWKHAGA